MRQLDFGIVALHAAAPLGVLVLMACSSSGEGLPPSANGDAGDGGRAISDTDASNDAESDADHASPPLYDFDVKCATDPCVTRIAARGGSHACVVLHDGTVRCWGANESGQLGTGIDDAGPISAFEASPRAVLGVANATGVAATGHGSSGTTCVVTATGEVSCFGSDAWGQLGRASAPSSEPHPEPSAIEGFQAKTVTLASRFALAIGTDDRVWSWGTNDVSQLAQVPDAGAGPPSLPAHADRIVGPVRSVAGTSTNGFLITQSGDLLSWGGTSSEQLGRLSSAAQHPIPVTLAIPGATSVATGDVHACATSRGGVRCWGQNDHGQLGTGRRAEELSPARVILPDGVYAVAVAAGGSNTCIIAAAGDVYCWGANDGGQIGVSERRDRATPSRIAGLEQQAVAVAVMDRAVCALLRRGSVACWGDNLYGQLGRGARDSAIHVEPAPVTFE